MSKSSAAACVSGRVAESRILRSDTGRERQCAAVECPVCLSAVTEPSDRVFLRCGHCVCASCDQQLLSNRFLQCPVCRVAREGVTDEQAQHANQLRDLQNRFENDISVGRSPVTMFFPVDVSGGSPLHALVPIRHRSSTADRRALRPNPVQRPTVSIRLRSATLNPIGRRLQRRGRATRARENDPEDQGEEGEEEEEAAHPAPHLDARLIAMIAGLTDPTPIGEFLVLRNRV